MASELSRTSWSEPPRRYRADGGCSAAGAAILGLAAIGAALALGLLQGYFISVGFNMFIFSAGMIGWGLGYLLTFGVKSGKVRSLLVCGAVAVVSGTVVIGCMHYFQYRVFENSLSRVPVGIREMARHLEAVQAQRDQLPPPAQEWLDLLAKNQELRESYAVASFLEYVDLMARRGLRVKDQKNPGREPERLGYWPTYLYWGAEWLIIVGVTYGFLAAKASQPYCCACQRWKAKTKSGLVIGVLKKAPRALLAGNLAAFDYSRGIEPKSVVLQMSLLECPQCGSPQEFEVRLETMRVGMTSNGQTPLKPTGTLCTVTYPAESRAAFDELFQPRQSLPVARSAARAADTEFAGSSLWLAWVLFGVSGLGVLGSVAYCWFLRTFEPTGFVISAILAGCGWALRWVARRNLKRR
jgi:hypothetical protein